MAQLSDEVFRTEDRRMSGTNQINNGCPRSCSDQSYLIAKPPLELQHSTAYLVGLGIIVLTLAVGLWFLLTVK
jgi:hypothetical protein